MKNFGKNINSDASSQVCIVTTDEPSFLFPHGKGKWREGESGKNRRRSFQAGNVAGNKLMLNNCNMNLRF